ncbi:MAG: exodeoxyribonuclease V subunit alpha [Myxococcota bacterium]|nr:exodeoxyribonuclease V subunit alpha [Myxococcota bacterium]
MSRLESYAQAGILSPLDLHFGRFIARSVHQEDNELLTLGAAVATRAPNAGHVCAELERLAETPVRDAEGQVLELEPWPKLEPWLQALSCDAVGDGTMGRPLVLDERGDLYLRRMWEYQHQLAQDLARRSALNPDGVDLELLSTGLAERFPDASAGDKQRLACAVGVLRSFSVISGGPGTGKTTTVARLLVVLQQQALAKGAPLRIQLLAPTGKAAARLSESLQASLSSMDLPEPLLAAMPERASTIHRALGWLPRTPTRFAHNAKRPLAADLVLVDEASMVDLSLMAKLVQAVPDHARLILLGDQNQLASVEAGAILGDICNAGGHPRGRSEQMRLQLEQLGADVPDTLPSAAAGPQDCIVQLTHSYRFDDSSGIGALARAINAGSSSDTLGVLADTRFKDVALRELSGGGPRKSRALRAALLSGFSPLCQLQDPAQALDALGRLRVLCAHRKGAWGVRALNQLAQGLLAGQGLIPLGEDWYPGRPVMITRNDYTLELFNGDVGIALRDASGRLLVWFEGSDGAPRAVHPARLPPHETVYATTVHKSQGSEFDRVLLLLPAHRSPLLTRELLYTGVTRARKQVEIFGTRQVLGAGVLERVQRASGLRAALWGA